MSNYPQTPSYGANPPYLPPTYTNQYLQSDDGRTSQGHMANNYDASMNAYGYNRSVPVPTFSAAAVASGVPPLPIFQGWNQDAMPLPPYNAPQVPQNAGQYSGYSTNTQAQQYYLPPALSQQQSYQQNTHQPKPFEQDLSEGEFEDSAGASHTPVGGYSATQYRANDGTGYVDTAQRAVYPRAQEYTPQQSYPPNNYNYPSRDQSQTTRQPSDSYSPYASPTVAGNLEPPSGAQLPSANAPNNLQELPAVAPSNQYGWPQKSAMPSQPAPSSNSHQIPQVAKSSSQPANATSQPLAPLSTNGVGTANGKSRAESRKKAQAAILNLYPYGIRYQTFVNEGFKEDIVGPLYDELQLSRSSPKTSNVPEPNSKSEVEGPPYQSQLRHEGVSPIRANGSPTGEVQASKAGQHSIAPLSVTTNGNVASPKATKLPTPNDQPKATVAPAPVKSVSMQEKDKAIKSKMEALRKSREDRAQKKIAARSAFSSAIPPVQDEQSKMVEEVSISKEALVTATRPLSKSPSMLINDLAPSIPSPASILNPQNMSDPIAKIAPAQHQLPAIPGLFLASSAGSPAPQASIQNSLQPSIPNNQRKRPVAADFDDSLSSVAAFKRPFGQSRNEKPLVIDVSDEELSDSEDVEMDLESVGDHSPALPSRKMSEHRAAPQANPTTSSFGQSKEWSSPLFSSPAGTPPISQQIPRAPYGRPEILQRKESEIQELKKKIAEAEAKKRAKQTPTGIQTPRVAESATTTPQPNGAPSSQVHTPSQVQQLIEAADKRIVQDQERLAAAQVVDAAKAAEIKLRAAEKKLQALEQKRLRREKIASDLAAIKASEDEELAIIEQKKAEVAEKEANLKKTLENKQKMLEEMYLLSQDEEEPETLVERHDNSNIRAAANGDPNLILSLNSTAEKLSQFTKVEPASKEDQTSSSQSNTPENTSNFRQESLNVSVQAIEGPATAVVGGEALVNGNSHADHVDAASQPASNEQMEQSKDILSPHQALEAAFQEAVRIEADSHVHTEDEMDTETSYAPDPVQLAPALPSTNSTNEILNSPEYCPELDRHEPNIPERELDDYEPPEASPLDTPINAAAQDYEPPEAAPIVDARSRIDSPPFSPAPPAAVSESTDDVISDINSAQIPYENASEDNLQHNKGSISKAIENVAEADRIQPFTPYNSALKHFRAYRFHPQFKQEVPGGLKSMTYSHRIDPIKELCRYELAGGICNDVTCDLQHFREIGLKDDVILTALGSPDEFQGEQRDRFCVGLKEVLLKLRVNKVRDFDIIASEIIAHRVKFLGDESKVLPLEGTTI